MHAQARTSDPRVRTRSLLLFFFLSSFTSLTAPAWADTAADAAFEHKPKPPADRVTLQLEDAELGELVRVMGETTGKKFVIASPKLAKVKASVYAPQKVTVAEAYQAFLAVLTANGLTVVPQAGFLKIVESQDAARQLTPLERGDLPPDERYVTRMHRLAHLSAEEVTEQVLSKLQTKDASIIPYPAGNLLIITETSANMRRMLEVLSELDSAGEEDKLWFRPVKYVSSSSVEKQLKSLLGLDDKQMATGSLRIARLIALERPNAIVIVGTRPSYERVSALLDLVDVPPSNASQVHVYALQYSDAKKIVGPINEAVSAASAPKPAAPGAPPAAAGPTFEGGIKVAADETTNSLIVTATEHDWAQLVEVIRALDKPKRQVFIEAAILDITAEHGTNLGVAWHGGHVHDAAIGPGGKTQTTYGGFRAGTSALPPSGDVLQAFALGVRGPEIPFAAGIPGLSTIPSFGAVLTALATQRGADILSTPSILASDNTPAEIKVQLQTSLQPNAPQIPPFPQIPGVPNVPVPTLPTSGVAASYRGIGPRVKVTPHLNDSDQVRLDVEEVISDIQNAPGPGDTFGTVSYLERTATTTLTVKNGQTIVIGGLVRSRLARQESKVPVLGDIPLLGVFFRTRHDEVQKSNLVLVLTPHIVRDEEDMRAIYERKMQERQEPLDRDAVFEGQEWSAPRDWRRTRGLLAHVRDAQMDVDRRRAALAAAKEETVVAKEVVPLDPPVPVTASGARRPAARIEPSKPSVVER